MLEPGKDTYEADNERFMEKKDERLNPDASYGGGFHNKRRPKPPTVPSSPSTDRAKPIKRG